MYQGLQGRILCGFLAMGDSPSLWREYRINCVHLRLCDISLWFQRAVVGQKMDYQTRLLSFVAEVFSALWSFVGVVNHIFGSVVSLVPWHISLEQEGIVY